MPISKEFTSIFTTKWEINFLQCYPNGILKYTDLCHLFQLVAAQHSVLGGISFTDMQHFHQAWVLSKMRVEINRLPQWKDKIFIKTWIKSIENSKSIRCFELYVGNEKLVGCETFWVVFNTQTRKPENLKIPYEHFEIFQNLNATEKTFSRIKIPTPLEFIHTKHIYLSDLDIVNHVNHVKYLEWCLDFVDQNDILNQKIKSFDLNYMKELSLKEVVEIYKNSNDTELFFSICKDIKPHFALQINKI